MAQNLGRRPSPSKNSKDAEMVIQACKFYWPIYSGDCSGFVKAVARELGVGLSGQANDIVKFMAANWWPIYSGKEARDWAEAGYLVVGGLEDTPNGHVVVVVPGSLAYGKYPTAYWGRLNGTGEPGNTINYAWNPTKRDKVIFCGALIHVRELPAFCK